MRVRDDHRLDDEVGDCRPDFGDIVFGAPQVLAEVAQRPLGPRLAGPVFAVVLAMLVDGIVRQVHVQAVLHNAGGRLCSTKWSR